MKELRIAQAEVSMIPLQRTTDMPDLLTLQDLVSEPLMRRQGGRAVPVLIGFWEYGGDGRSILLTIRRDARFHDGYACTAEDILKTLTIVRDARDGFGMRGAYARYLTELEFTIQGRDQLLITGQTPVSNLPDIFCEIYVRKPDAQGQPIIGTGPFRVVGYADGDSVVLAPAEAGGPYDTVSVVEIPEAADRYQALVAGQVNMATGLELLKQQPAEDGLWWRQSRSMMSVPYFLNGFDLPFSQPEARLAINLAVDVDAIIREVWNGLAEPAATVVSPFHLGYPSGLAAHGYDPDRARALFDRCQMPASLHLRTPQHMPDRAEGVSQMIKEQLARIGIVAEIEVVEDRPDYARQVGARRIGHMAIFDSTPHSTYRVLQEKVTSRNPGMWWQGVSDEGADDLIAEASQTTDPTEALREFARCLSWLHETPHWLYMYHPIQRYAHQPGITGVSIDNSGLVEIAQP